MGYGRIQKSYLNLNLNDTQVCQKQFDVNSRTNNSHYRRPKARQRVLKRAGICSNGITRHVGSQLKGQAHVKQLFKAASTHSTRGLPAVWFQLQQGLTPVWGTLQTPHVALRVPTPDPPENLQPPTINPWLQHFIPPLSPAAPLLDTSLAMAFLQRLTGKRRTQEGGGNCFRGNWVVGLQGHWCPHWSAAS